MMPDNRERLVELAECKCPERDWDLICYGIRACRDGKRIAPEDLYMTPEEMEATRSRQREANPSSPSSPPR